MMHFRYYLQSALHGCSYPVGFSHNRWTGSGLFLQWHTWDCLIPLYLKKSFIKCNKEEHLKGADDSVAGSFGILKHKNSHILKQLCKCKTSVKSWRKNWHKKLPPVLFKHEEWLLLCYICWQLPDQHLHSVRWRVFAAVSAADSTSYTLALLVRTLKGLCSLFLDYLQFSLHVISHAQVFSALMLCSCSFENPQKYNHTTKSLSTSNYNKQLNCVFFSLTEPLVNILNMVKSCDITTLSLHFYFWLLSQPNIQCL